MKRLVEYAMQDGSSILVEVEEPESAGGMERAVRPGEVIERAKESFEIALERIRPAIDTIISTLREVTDTPDEISVESGIKFGAEAGAFLASADSEATFKVTLKWKGSISATGNASASSDARQG